MNNARGTLTKWIEEKSFGFIRPEGGGQDVFVHIRDFGAISRKPKIGDIMRYQLSNDGTGRFRAADVSIEGVSRLPGRPRVRNESVYSGSGKSRATGVSVEGATRLPGRPRERPKVVSPEGELSPGYGAIAFVIVFCCALGGLTVLGKVPVVVPFIYLVVSCITFIVYALDKSAAMGNRWRTREATLHFLGVMCGWPGALMAQSMFCHKSKKGEFLITFWTTVAFNNAVLIWSATQHGRSVIISLVG